MKIYVTHSTQFEYQNELYLPLRNSSLNATHQIMLPHESSAAQFDSKAYLKACDLVIAEVTYPSTGQGIELGFASIYEVPILCIYKKGSKISGALSVVSHDFLEYENSTDMISQLADFVSALQKNSV